MNKTGGSMNLHDAIDQNKFIIDNLTLTDDEIQAMDIDALETLKMQIVKKINGLSASIKEKQIEYASGGKSASKEWYMSRKSALSINQRVLTYVNSLIKKRYREARTISDYFMGQAKLFLKENDYETILINAQREMALITRIKIEREKAG
jgi:hypothetical protein